MMEESSSLYCIFKEFVKRLRSGGNMFASCPLQHRNYESALRSVDKMTSREFSYDYRARVESIDQSMKDKVRLDNFKAAIVQNKHIFKDKTVLDIFCGVGILSLFAAKAGAAKVFAIDPSNVIDYTREVVAANGYDNIIKVYKGAVEDIELPVQQVDIIVCDWMGYALLYQSKCREVIYARDKWLKPGGLIFPDKGKLFIVAVENEEIKTKNIEWWNLVYDFKMDCVRDTLIKQPIYQLLKPCQVLSKPYHIKDLDLYTAKIDDFGFCSNYRLNILKNKNMHGIALYFEIHFTECHKPLSFSTNPSPTMTYWLQTVFLFDKYIVDGKKGQIYDGTIDFRPTKTSGELDDIKVNFEMKLENPSSYWQMTWHMKS